VYNRFGGSRTCTFGVVESHSLIFKKALHCIAAMRLLPNSSVLHKQFSLQRDKLWRTIFLYRC